MMTRTRSWPRPHFCLEPVGAGILAARMSRPMSRIAAVFRQGRARQESVLIAYLMAGDPSLDATAEYVLALERAGADLVELGVPFSDPIADGPVIQRASERALKAKTTLTGILTTVARLRARTQIPLLLMTYYNPVLRFGEARFATEASAAGVDGVIIPDLPPEEAGGLRPHARRAGLETVFLLAPTSPIARIRRVAAVSTGFLYYVSLTGITGAALGNLRDVQTRIALIRRYTTQPIAVGFGIASPADAARLAGAADGVIVGSALVRLLETSQHDAARQALGQAAVALKAGLARRPR